MRNFSFDQVKRMTGNPTNSTQVFHGQANFVSLHIKFTKNSSMCMWRTVMGLIYECLLILTLQKAAIFVVNFECHNIISSSRGTGNSTVLLVLKSAQGTVFARRRI